AHQRGTEALSRDGLLDHPRRTSRNVDYEWDTDPLLEEVSTMAFASALTELLAVIRRHDDDRRLRPPRMHEHVAEPRELPIDVPQPHLVGRQRRHLHVVREQVRSMSVGVVHPPERGF